MTAWPLVKNRLVAVLPSLPGWSQVSVFDGQRVTGDTPGDYATVGYVPNEDFAGSFEQRHLEWAVEEEGTVRTQVVSQVGDANDNPGRETRVFALADAWQTWVVANPTLGVLNPSSTASLAVDVEPIQNSAGSAARLIVTVSYIARI